MKKQINYFATETNETNRLSTSDRLLVAIDRLIAAIDRKGSKLNESFEPFVAFAMIALAWLQQLILDIKLKLKR